jgi:hypothetical protein
VQERLTSIDAQKKHAIDAKNLLLYFLAFNEAPGAGNPLCDGLLNSLSFKKNY